MDWTRSPFEIVKAWLAWLPNQAVAVIILLLAIAIAYSLHRIGRKLIRRLLAERYPFMFSIFIRMRGVTQLALLIFTLVIAIPVAPIDLATAQMLARLLLIGVIGLIGWGAITALKIT